MNRFFFHTILLASGAATALAIAACASKAEADVQKEPTLKEIFDGKFVMGAAINTTICAGDDSVGEAAFLRHFNSAVAENCMKCEPIHPEQNRYNWAPADSFINFCQKHNLHTVGHCLIWHSQCAPWFLVDKEGNYVSADTLKQRMREHIHAVVGRYKGKVDGWDVVNEAVVEDGSFRKSGFYEILGEEFIPLAFEYAHEADPDAELYLNDYGMNIPERRNTYVRIINDLKKRGLRIDAIGMQSHMGMDYPDLKEFEESLNAFVGTGCKVMITEWDMSALPTINRGANISDRVAFQKVLNPYPDGLPDSIATKWNDRMGQAMALFVKHADDITRVTAWGVHDGDSWKNNWPMPGRTDYPLLLDRNYQPKPFLLEFAKK